MKQLHVFSVFGTVRGFFDGQFEYLHNCGYEIHVISSGDACVDDFCQRNHIQNASVDITRSISIKKDIKAICYVIRYVKKNNIEAVFGHTPKGALVAMTAAFLAGVKHRVYYRHGVVYTTASGLKKVVLKFEERFVSLLATDIVNVSHSLSRLAVRDHLNSDSKQYVIGHGTCGGIDAEALFNPMLIDKTKLSVLRGELGVENANIVFGFCGRICNDKGIPELVGAFELFERRHPELRSKMVLIGGMDSRDGISEIMRMRILQNKNIVITNHVDKLVIPYYYSLLDVFIFPSHREGFGMCVLEASAMEKPILVSHAHGCEDSIIENETGRYIPLTAVGICAGMEEMLDVQLRDRMGHAGREMVLQYYDYHIMWKEVQRLYEEMLQP